jgi:hypothetical protein
MGITPLLISSAYGSTPPHRDDAHHLCLHREQMGRKSIPYTQIEPNAIDSFAQHV